MRVADLEAKQKDTTKALNTTQQSDKRIVELELALSKMRQQQEILQKKIKEDGDRKIKLEKDFEKEQQKLKDLELRSEQQQKLLKKKTEDLLVAQRRIRSASTNMLNNLNGPSTQSEESLAARHCIEQEIEKVVQDKCNLGDPGEVSDILQKMSHMQSDDAKNVVKKCLLKINNLKETEQKKIFEINELHVNSFYFFERVE